MKQVKTLMSLWSFARPYKKRVFLVLMSVILTAITTLMIGQGIRLFIDSYSETIGIAINEAILLLMILGVLLSIGTFSRYYNVSWLGARICADIRIAVFSNLVSLNPRFFDENSSTELHSRITNDTNLLQHLLGSSCSLALRNIILLIGGIFLLIYSHTLLALVVFGLAPCILLPLMIFGRKVKSLSTNTQSSIDHLSNRLHENFQNIKTLQAFRRQTIEKSLFTVENEQVFELSEKNIFFRALLIGSVIFVVMLAITGLLYLGATWLDAGEISSGELFGVIFYAILASSSLGVIIEVLSDLQKAELAIDRLMYLMSCSEEFSFFDNANQSDDGKNVVDENSIKEARQEIVFNKVTFSYQSESIAVLKMIDCHFLDKGLYAIVGRSGAGKSTILELMMRFYEPTSGEICYFGKSIQAYTLDELRRMIGYVSQEIRLFSGTVLENVNYGNNDYTEEQVLSILSQYLPENYWHDFPNGWKTTVKDNQKGLSGGQIQRIAIARALLLQPKILLLDEVTSALDPEKETLILGVLKKLAKHCCVIVVTHRMSFLPNFDRIFLLDKGEIISEGEHNDLLKNSKIYRSFNEVFD